MGLNLLPWGGAVCYMQPDNVLQPLFVFDHYKKNNSRVQMVDVVKEAGKSTKLLPFLDLAAPVLRKMENDAEAISFLLSLNSIMSKPRAWSILFGGGKCPWQMEAQGLLHRLCAESELFVLPQGQWEHLLGEQVVDFLYAEAGTEPFLNNGRLLRLLLAVKQGGIVFLRCPGRELPQGLRLSPAVGTPFLLADGGSLWRIGMVPALWQMVRKHGPQAQLAGRVRDWLQQVRQMAERSACLAKYEGGGDRAETYADLVAGMQAVEQETLQLYLQLDSIEVKQLSARAYEAALDCLLGQGNMQETAAWTEKLLHVAEMEAARFSKY